MKIILLQLLFLSFGIQVLYGQPTKLKGQPDQLNTVATDTIYIEELNKLTYQIINTDPALAFQKAQSALLQAKKIHYARGEAGALFNIGYYHKLQGNYADAMVFSFKALTIFETLGDDKGIADCYNLAAIVSYSKDNKIELDYYLKALTLYKKIKDWGNVAKVYGNIGDTYAMQGKFEKALYNFNNGIEISQTYHDNSMLAYCYYGIGELYGRKKDYPQALSYLEKSLDIFTQLNDKTFITYVLESIADIYLNKKMPEQALTHYFMALDSAQKYGFKDQIKISALGLSKTFASLNDYKKAYKYHQLYEIAKDSLKGRESLRSISDLKAVYELEKKQAKITLLQKDQQIKIKEAERHQMFIYFLLAFFALCIVLGISGFRIFRQTKKINHLLQTQKEDSERQQKKITEQNTVLEEKNLELSIAKEKAESASKAKANFLSTMSHEIRTPMNAVIGLTHLLIQEDPKPEQLSRLSTLKFSTENLLALINDILDFSKIEAGKIEMESIDFSVQDLIASIREAQAIRSNQKGIALITDCDKNIPVLMGDPVRLGQVLTNLISNAIKFTQHGSVTVEVKLISKNTQQATLHFAVTDTGIGIPSDKINDIFESFTQAHSNTTRIFGGTGLGLSIIKSLLALMQTQILVESEPGKGSRFSFDLTLNISKIRVEKATGIAHTQKTFKLKGVRILLVDDNEINLMIASAFLRKWEVEVDTAANGNVAIEKVRNNFYDIVLMDLQMPVMDGYEATKIIRQMGEMVPYFQSLPIFALTADAITDVKDKVMLAGMNDYVTKPFVPEELYHKIMKCLPDQAEVKA